jgi:hypothetical protein
MAKVRCGAKSHKSQLETAKASLLAAQSNVQLAFELQHLNVTSEAQQSLRQLRDEHTDSAEVVEEIKALASDIHTQQEEDCVLANVTNVSLDRVVVDNQTLLTRSALSEQSAHDAKVAANLTQNAITSLSADLVKGFDNLPMMLAPMIENSIAKSLAEHNTSNYVGTNRPKVQGQEVQPLQRERL